MFDLLSCFHYLQTYRGRALTNPVKGKLILRWSITKNRWFQVPVKEE